MKNFKDLIADTIINQLRWGGPAPPDPEDTDNIPDEALSKGLLLQDSNSERLYKRAKTEITEDMPQSKPNDGFFTPLWNIDPRPLSAKLISEENQIPSAFVYELNGIDVTDSIPSDKVEIGNQVEDTYFAIEAVFEDGKGSLVDPNEAYNNEKNNAAYNPIKDIRSQVSGFVYDLGVLLRPNVFWNIDFTVLSNSDNIGTIPDGFEVNTKYTSQLPSFSIMAAGNGGWQYGISDDLEKVPSIYEIIRYIYIVRVQYPILLESPIRRI